MKSEKSMKSKKSKKEMKARSDAGRLLASFNGAAHAAAARQNGKLGGRPSFGLCDVRELRRRLREYCLNDPSRDSKWFRRYQVLCADALVWRMEIIDQMKAAGQFGEVTAGRIVFSHPLVNSVEPWRRLLLRSPGMF